jgi:hypothetical protein
MITEIEKDHGPDPREGEVMTPKEQVEKDLRDALRMSKLGYNVTAQKLITEALEIIERKL